jgi:hypothetical protein
VAYYIGITIKKIAFPRDASPKLRHQYLFGVPVALIVVSPMLPVFRSTISNDISAYLIAIGIVIEHGMLVQESITIHLKARLTSASMSESEPPSSASEMNVPEAPSVG